MGLVLSGCCVHCQQPVKMLRLMSGTPSLHERERVCVRMYVCSSLRKKALSGSCVVWMLRPLSAACQDAPSMSGTPSLQERERVCVYVCMCVAVCERKPLSGSCVVWMLHPLSAAGPGLS